MILALPVRLMPGTSSDMPGQLILTCNQSNKAAGGQNPHGKVVLGSQARNDTCVSRNHLKVMLTRLCYFVAASKTDHSG